MNKQPFASLFIVIVFTNFYTFYYVAQLVSLINQQLQFLDHF